MHTLEPAKFFLGFVSPISAVQERYDTNDWSSEYRKVSVWCIIQGQNYSFYIVNQIKK